MDINIEPMDNGWLVVDRTTRGRKVFTDREKMLEYLNEVIPATRDEQGFIDGLDDESDNRQHEMEDEIIQAIENSYKIPTPKAKRMKNNQMSKRYIESEAFGIKEITKLL